MLLTRAPVASGQNRSSVPAAPRLACVKPVASVHPEPGSNSSLLFMSFSFFSYKNKARLLFVIRLFCFHVTLAFRLPVLGLSPDLSVLRIDSRLSLFSSSCTTLVSSFGSPSVRLPSASIVILSMFSRVLPATGPKIFAKIDHYFLSCKFFFIFSSTAASRCVARPLSFPKASAKVVLSLFPCKFFYGIFSDVFRGSRAFCG